MIRGAQVGVDERRDTTITAVEPSGHGYRVILGRHGHAETVETDLVVLGAGRVAAEQVTADESQQAGPTAAGIPPGAPRPPTATMGR